MNQEAAGSPANIVGLGAKRVGVPTLPASAEIPVAWKRSCRQILLHYEQEPVRRNIGPAKSHSAVRDEIMYPYDPKTDKGRPDRRGSPLGRSLFEFFMKGQTDLRDTAFAFVDKFVRTLQLSDDYAPMFADIVRLRTDIQKSALADIYSLRDPAAISRAETSLLFIEGSFFTSGRIKWSLSRPTWLSSTWLNVSEPAYVTLYVGDYDAGASDVCAIYSDHPFEDIDEQLIRKLPMFFGYLIPSRWTPTTRGSYDGWSEMVLILSHRGLTGSEDQAETSSSLVTLDRRDFTAHGFPFVGNPTKRELTIKGVSVTDKDGQSRVGEMSVMSFNPTFAKNSAVVEAINSLRDWYLLW